MTQRTLTTVISLVDRAVLFLAAVLLCVEIVLVTANVFTRYLLHSPLVWSAELARYCMVWSALLGSAVLVRRHEHLSVTIIDRWLSPRGLRILHVGIATVSMFFFSVLLISGCVLVVRTWGQAAASLPHLPISVVYAVVPLAALLMLRNAALALRQVLAPEDSGE